MTASEILELRKQKRRDEAYEAARHLYATDKGPQASSAMFWTAVDILKQKIAEKQMVEARKILLALERLLPNVPDEDGQVQKAFTKSHDLLNDAENREKVLERGARHLQMGRWGEDLAVAYLREKGYVILERDWHSGHRDIDIIAVDKDVVVFVEVKTRRNEDFGDPALAVDYKKRRNLRSAINHYLNYHNINQACRFDIITVVGALGSTTPVINHLEDVNIIELHYRR